jgi:hypothetical protein
MYLSKGSTYTKGVHNSAAGCSHMTVHHATLFAQVQLCSYRSRNFRGWSAIGAQCGNGLDNNHASNVRTVFLRMYSQGKRPPMYSGTCVADIKLYLSMALRM